MSICTSWHVRRNSRRSFRRKISAHRNAIGVKHARLTEGYQHRNHRVSARKEAAADLRAPERRAVDHQEHLWVLVSFSGVLRT